MRVLPPIVLLFIVLLSMMPGSRVFATTYVIEGDSDYSIPAKDNRSLRFFMTVPPHVANLKKSDMELSRRKGHPKSGLFKSQYKGRRFLRYIPLWTVTWYERKSQIALSSDGRFLMRMTYAGQKKNAVSFIFYDAGKEIKRYKMSALGLAPLKFPSHYRLRWWPAPKHILGVEIDRQDYPRGDGHLYGYRGQFVKGYIFDMRTGTVQSRHIVEGEALKVAKGILAPRRPTGLPRSLSAKGYRKPAQPLKAKKQWRVHSQMKLET